MVKNGVNIEYRDKEKYTGFIYACQHVNLDIAKLLLRYNVDVEARNRHGKCGYDYLRNDAK